MESAIYIAMTIALCIFIFTNMKEWVSQKKIPQIIAFMILQFLILWPLGIAELAYFIILEIKMNKATKE